MTLEQYLNEHKKTHLIFDFDETLGWLILPWDKWDDKIRDHLVPLDADIYERFEKGLINLSELQNEYIHKFSQTKKLIIDHETYFETTFLKEVRPNLELIEFIQKHENYTYYLWSSN